MLMKKKFFFAASAAIFCVSGYLLMKTHSTGNGLTDLQLENIDALSDTEEEGYLYVVPVEYENGWGCNCAGKGDLECCA